MRVLQLEETMLCCIMATYEHDQRFVLQVLHVTKDAGKQPGGDIPDLQGSRTPG